ncbi:RDD family protein [Micromonospora sp. NPDC048871]|uniref:RDD family protein n=2 Tax=unclassified Micromonospora TaxID=2617518 RepID=UPI0037234746
MTLRGMERPSTRLEAAKAYAEHAWGPGTSRRVATFTDGTPYLRAGLVGQVLAWLIDAVVCLFGVGVCVVALALLHDGGQGLSIDAVAVLALAACFVVPMLYGLCYRNGRALGGVLTGTRLVRVADGGRLGLTGCWAMVVRTVFLPILLAIVVLSAATGLGMAGSRTSIDRAATRQLRDAGLR